MSNNKQTAVDFLLKELQEIGVLNIINCHWSDEVEVKKAIQQAKQMENQQRGYSEEEVEQMINSFEKLCYKYQSNKDWFPSKKSEWFEQFKKK